MPFCQRRLRTAPGRKILVALSLGLACLAAGCALSPPAPRPAPPPPSAPTPAPPPPAVAKVTPPPTPPAPVPAPIPKPPAAAKKVPPPKPAAPKILPPPAVAENAYAVETIRCEGPAGVWALVYEGQVTAATNAQLRMRLDRRIGVRYHPDREGVDDTDWWCIPKRRFCYSEVGFADWGGTRRPSQVVSVALKDAISVAQGLQQGLLAAIQAQCP